MHDNHISLRPITILYKSSITSNATTPLVRWRESRDVRLVRPSPYHRWRPDAYKSAIGDGCRHLFVVEATSHARRLKLSSWSTPLANCIILYNSLATGDHYKERNGPHSWPHAMTRAVRPPPPSSTPPSSLLHHLSSFLRVVAAKRSENLRLFRAFRAAIASVISGLQLH